MCEILHTQGVTHGIRLMWDLPWKPHLFVNLAYNLPYNNKEKIIQSFHIIFKNVELLKLIFNGKYIFKNILFVKIKIQNYYLLTNMCQNCQGTIVFEISKWIC